ncbi:MAG: hypothetical protein Q8O57_03780 [Kiritimatiellota bacterium]|nr:hypothetical protein [Kiritimatiellota bacterium]
MLFSRPVRRGEIVCFESRIVCAGKTRLIAYIETKVKDQTVISGFITFMVFPLKILNEKPSSTWMPKAIRCRTV